MSKQPRKRGKLGVKVDTPLCVDCAHTRSDYGHIMCGNPRYDRGVDVVRGGPDADMPGAWWMRQQSSMCGPRWRLVQAAPADALAAFQGAGPAAAAQS